MDAAHSDFDLLAGEHRALIHAHGRAQAQCSELARELDRLQGQTMRLRAEVIRRDTALAWAREDRAALERAAVALPRRRVLAQRVDALLAHIQELMRERTRADWHRVHASAVAPPVALATRPCDAATLEASLREADLVICQTGCVSHGAYWRVQDHCRRTGKTCVLVTQPDALRIVRVHAA